MNYDLEKRLIDFAVSVIEVTDNVSRTRAGIHLSGQLIRSGTSPALNYGEAQSAESRKDFIHKMKVILKELRETFICLKIIAQSKCCFHEESLIKVKAENNELISIFVKSIETAERNR